MLLLTDKDIDGGTAEVPLFTNLVFKETLVRILDVLRQIGKEYECRNLRSLQLSAIFYLDVLALG